MLYLPIQSKVYHQKSNVQLQGYVDAVPQQYNEDLKQLIQRIQTISDISSTLGVIVSGRVVVENSFFRCFLFLIDR